MTELEKMYAGEFYNIADPEIQASLIRAKKLCAQLRTMTIYDEGYLEFMQQLIPSFSKGCEICPPFHCDHGHRIKLGHKVFMNYNCVILDCGEVSIGDNVLIGPNCQLYTPEHPFDAVARRQPVEHAKPISIGDDTWLGGNVTVCPGVKIGKRCIIGAGSVVTHDIPDDVVAAGNPCRVVRKATSSERSEGDNL